MKDVLDEINHVCMGKKSNNFSLITDTNTGETMCSKCGHVLNDKLEEIGAEYALHSTEDYLDKSRVGRKSTLAFNDMGLSTIIEQSDRDSTGKGLSGEMKRTFYRLRMWDKNSKARPGQRNMQKAFTILEGLKAKLSLTEAAVEKSAYIYRKALGKKIGRGRSIPVIISASIYAACRFTNTPRTIQDISNATNIKRTTIHRMYRMLVRELDLTIETYNPIEFISRISSTLKITEKAKRDAVKILIKAESLMVTSGKNPMAIAATVVYLAALANNQKITQTQVANASEISSVTIRNLCRVFKNAKELVIKN
jgi:transcription initiation factor TFIIB|tara:strand:- start:221 stop:1150 length:930 start_codon:yes stop_codon:yes gene_type:complete